MGGGIGWGEVSGGRYQVGGAIGIEWILFFLHHLCIP